MTCIGQIGDTVQTSFDVTEMTVSKMKVEWAVRNFFSLSDKENDHYESPVFIFAGSKWCLKLYPNVSEDFKYALTVDPEGSSSTDCRELEDASSWVALSILRKDCGPSKSLKYMIGCHIFNEEEEFWEGEWTFSRFDCEYGERLWTRHCLKTEASRFFLDNVWTIICYLKCKERKSIKDISRRELSLSMKRMLSGGKRTDFTLKLGDREWPVHKVILESRCEYFVNMFRHEWIENTVGEVTFEDITEDALDNVLVYIYTGDVECMSSKNVCDIYIASSKFLLDNLKALCVEHMKENMSLELICKALVIADNYGEEDLHRSAINFFVSAEDQVFDSEEWKELKKYHGSVAADFLEKISKMKKKNAKFLERLSSTRFSEIA